MKKYFKFAAVAFVLIVGILVLIPAFLPGHAHVQREIFIERGPEAVYAILADFRQNQYWDPWVEEDRQTKVTITGTGTEAVYAWDGPNSGQGESRFTAVEPGRFLKLGLKTFRPMKGEFTSDWKLTPSGAGTTATWSFDQDFPYLMRYMHFFLDGMIGSTFERGLKNLKTYVERPPASPAAPSPENRDSSPSK